MLNSTAVDLPLLKSAVLVSQFLQLYLQKKTLPAVSEASSRHPKIRQTKIVLCRVLSLLRHRSKAREELTPRPPPLLFLHAESDPKLCPKPILYDPYKRLADKKDEGAEDGQTDDSVIGNSSLLIDHLSPA